MNGRIIFILRNLFFEILNIHYDYIFNKLKYLFGVFYNYKNIKIYIFINQ